MDSGVTVHKGKHGALSHEQPCEEMSCYLHAGFKRSFGKEPRIFDM